MKCKIALVALLGLSLGLTGCVIPHQLPAYSADLENIEVLQSYGLAPISVGAFRAGEAVKIKTGEGVAYIRCRGDHHITARPNFEREIERAFIEELTLAGIYDVSSPVELTGTLEKIEFKERIAGDGSWTVTLTIANKRNESFTKTVSTPFTSSLGARAACIKGSSAFEFAVRQLIKEIISDPQFRKIAN